MKYIELLYKTESLLKGHFMLSSGKHSDSYVQCARLLTYPDIAEIVAKGLKEKLEERNINNPTVIIGPAIGGITIAYELARQFKCRGIFCEKTNKTKYGFTLRRGFKVDQDDRIILVEDVLTTGGSIRKVYNYFNDNEFNILGVASIIDRRLDESFLSDLNPVSLIKLKFNLYESEKCPLCKSSIPIEKPGSSK